MDESEAVAALRALGEPTRLKVMLLLVGQQQPIAAGSIAQKLKVRQNTLSAHIAILARHDMIIGHRQGRNIHYGANPRTASRLTRYLSASLCKAPENVG
jgi:ArsR family transcriptional regulator, arsenate/arsenite/antimonite-responsive transcriptional repressor